MQYGEDGQVLQLLRHRHIQERIHVAIVAVHHTAHTEERLRRMVPPAVLCRDQRLRVPHARRQERVHGKARRRDKHTVPLKVRGEEHRIHLAVG